MIVPAVATGNMMKTKSDIAMRQRPINPNHLHRILCFVSISKSDEIITINTCGIILIFDYLGNIF